MLSSNMCAATSAVLGVRACVYILARSVCVSIEVSREMGR